MTEKSILHSVFYIILHKKGALPVEKEFIKDVKSEYGITNEDFNRIYNEWNTNPVIVPTSNSDDNKTMLGFMIYSAFVKGNLNAKDAELLRSFAKKIGVNIENYDKFTAIIKKDLRLADNIKNIINYFDNVKNISPVSKPKERYRSYIATQITKEGIDEIQALAMCYKLGLNVALDGLPGVGKTQSVIELSELFDLKLFTKTCSSKTTESHIISHPILTERNGVSVTEHANGPLVLAMITPGVFYGDEYNLLKEDVQKRMNSAFDDRKYIDRNDGEIIKSKEGFFSIISYNPSKDISSRDLEDSVADRFVHFNYREWPSDLKAYISMKKNKKDIKLDYKDFNIKLEERGISKNGNFYIKDNGKWFDFMTRKQAESQPDYIYNAFYMKTLNQQDGESKQALEILSQKAFNEIELSRVFSKFSELINELIMSGKSLILSKIGLDNLNSNEETELLQVHRTSTRIVSAALLHYRYLTQAGFNKYLAQSYATSIIVNQMCFGTYRNMKLKETTNYELVLSIAKGFGLIADNKVYNTNFIRENLL
ncbi:MAG TPA: MoxR family ATPase [Spirochaetota bacterium]|nr:MoxR family ATPase [Spirochaetota bacterium]HOS32282.1 MoxR family ATPase [Spirochaetota bacterium]HOS55694.1 MoxR family ATPase [Spirochaetota bacterium]HQF78058.1 MoxR family ATPase [Spirochaetota bacterium]HQH31292.1 MoxR family ATPase [Spirochaetota bacterium]